MSHPAAPSSFHFSPARALSLTLSFATCAGLWVPIFWAITALFSGIPHAAG